MRYAILAPIVLAGIALIAYGVHRLWLLRAISEWSPLKATIVSAELLDLSLREGEPQFRPKLKYEYSVQGKSFSSTVLGISESAFDFHSEDEAKEFMARVSPGSHVDVLVNPTVPRDAFLAPGASGMRRNHYTTTIASGLFVLLASAGVGWLMHA